MSECGGALTVFRQFLKHLQDHIGGDRYYVFKDGGVETPVIDGVEYIVDNNHSVWHRTRFDAKGLKQWCRGRGIVPDLVISFQNSAANIGCRQIVYYHQSLPFYPERWNPFKSDERTLFFYTYVYPLMVKRTLKGDIDAVVQTESLRAMFAECYNFDYEKTHAMFPDVDKIDVASIVAKSLDADKFHFIYPANAAKYKRHDTLIDALALLRKQGYEHWDKVRIYLTFSEGTNPVITKQIEAADLKEQFVFLGQLPYAELLSYYKAADGMLFPSTIETIGLPLLEGAAFGLPIVATDKPYAKDVLKGYDGVAHIDSGSPQLWADEIRRNCRKQYRYKPLAAKESTWPQFFELIHKR